MVVFIMRMGKQNKTKKKKTKKQQQSIRVNSRNLEDREELGSPLIMCGLKRRRNKKRVLSVVIILYIAKRKINLKV